jgi:hypothetical protein
MTRTGRILFDRAEFEIRSFNRTGNASSPPDPSLLLFQDSSDRGVVLAAVHRL